MSFSAAGRHLIALLFHRRSLDRSSTPASVASTPKARLVTEMNYLRILTAVLTLLLLLSVARAQEAVVEPTPIIPAKEKAKEEKAEKEAKEKAAPEKKSIRETMTPEEFKAA